MRKKPSYAKAAVSAVGDVAEQVETVAGGVKTGARQISKGMNSNHRATRAKRPSGIITRAEAAGLPDIPSRIFVDPLNDRKQIFAQNIVLHPAGVAAIATTVSDRYASYVFTSYQTATMQAVKYDTSAIMDIDVLRAYINLISNYLFNYYTVCHQKAFLLDGESVSHVLNIRAQLMYDAEVEQALANFRFAINQYAFPPRLEAFIKWFAGIYSLGRTPNANLGQFTTDELTFANTPGTIAALFEGFSAAMVPNSRKLSSVLMKLQPWQLKVPAYVDLPRNAAYDFNWLNMWVNSSAYTDANDTTPHPTTSQEYVLYNDNPNFMCTAMTTFWDAGLSEYQPGIISGNFADPEMMIVSASTGVYVGVTDISSLFGAKRWTAYQVGAVADTYPSVNADPETKSVAITQEDTIVDTTSAMMNLFHVDDMSIAGTNALTARK